jgi:phage terminase small subunit
MANQRKSAKILELSGAFKQNPQRRRVDAVGTRPADLKKPPGYLPEKYHETWRSLVAALPAVDFYNSDEHLIAIAATAVWACFNAEDEKQLRLARGSAIPYLSQLGLGPQARYKLLPTAGKQPGQRSGLAPSGKPWTGNPWADC